MFMRDANGNLQVKCGVCGSALEERDWIETRSGERIQTTKHWTCGRCVEAALDGTTEAAFAERDREVRSYRFRRDH